MLKKEDRMGECGLLYIYIYIYIYMEGQRLNQSHEGGLERESMEGEGCL